MLCLLKLCLLSMCFIYTAPQASSFKQKPCTNEVALLYFFFYFLGSCYDLVIDSSDTTGDSGTYAFLPASDAVLDNAGGSAWCTANSAPDAYLQVDFGEVKVVCAVAVQGILNANNNGFSRSFKLSFATSEVSNEWTQYYEEGGNARVS